jgi:SMP-30/Gluconolactonase/LRE-like region
MSTHPSLTVLLAALAAIAPSVPSFAQEPQIITGLKQPESIALRRGQVYISETGEYEKPNDGYISVLEGDSTRTFATGLDDPHGIKWWGDHLFVADNMGMVWRIDAKGNVERFVDATDFPLKTTNFNDLEIDGAGNIYISDSGDWEGGGGVIFRITQQKKISVVLTEDDDTRLVSPNGLLMDGPNRLLVVDYTTGILFRVDLRTKPATMEKIAGAAPCAPDAESGALAAHQRVRAGSRAVAGLHLHRPDPAARGSRPGVAPAISPVRMDRPDGVDQLHDPDRDSGPRVCRVRLGA